jgi:hypothetical protein
MRPRRASFSRRTFSSSALWSATSSKRLLLADMVRWGGRDPGRLCPWTAVEAFLEAIVGGRCSPGAREEASLGEEASERLEELSESCLAFCPLADVVAASLGAAMPDAAELLIPLGKITPCALRLDEERWRLDDIGCVGPKMVLWVPCSTSGSPADVDDAVDATDAVCCRSATSSRVSRFTY